MSDLLDADHPRRETRLLGAVALPDDALLLVLKAVGYKVRIMIRIRFPLTAQEEGDSPVMGGWCETCSTVRTNSPLSQSPRNCSPRNGFKGFFSEPVSFSRRVNWPLKVARNQRVTRSCRSPGVVPSAMAAKRSFGSPQYAVGRRPVSSAFPSGHCFDKSVAAHKETRRGRWGTGSAGLMCVVSRACQWQRSHPDSRRGVQSSQTSLRRSSRAT